MDIHIQIEWLIGGENADGIARKLGILGYLNGRVGNIDFVALGCGSSIHVVLADDHVHVAITEIVAPHNPIIS